MDGGAEFIRRCFDEVDMELLGFSSARRYRPRVAARFVEDADRKIGVLLIFEFSIDLCD